MASNLPARIEVPQTLAVTDDKGNPLAGPELEGVLKVVTQMAQVAQLARINRNLEREQSEGKTDTRTLTATSVVQAIDLVQAWPFAPWIEGLFINRGPGICYVSVNDDREFRTMLIGETDDRDHSKSDRRIEKFYYYCLGDPTTLEVRGKY